MMSRILTTIAVFLIAPGLAQARPHWLESWAAAPAPFQANAPLTPELKTPLFTNQTIVQVVRLSAGGRRVRIRFTNEYGTTPLTIGAASVKRLDHKGAGSTSSAQALSFDGHPTAVIPAGAPLLSDPVELPVGALSSLSIALYVPGSDVACTCHANGEQSVALSPPGNYTQRPFDAAPSEPPHQYRAFISAVDVESLTADRVILTLGDSITDGFRSTLDTNRRWPDRLAERLSASLGARSPAVANVGISGNRLLSDGYAIAFGQSALGRFDRDVLAAPGATHLIILEGVNDIGIGAASPPAAADIIAAYRQMIDRAHARGLKVIGGTILPYEGAAYFRPEGEAVRKAVNAWIRTGSAFDGVIDFDRAIQDPARPSRMRADLQSGDWLHPNDAGYRIMGDAVDLAVFR